MARVNPLRALAAHKRVDLVVVGSSNNPFVNEQVESYDQKLQEYIGENASNDVLIRKSRGSVARQSVATNLALQLTRSAANASPRLGAGMEVPNPRHLRWFWLLCPVLQGASRNAMLTKGAAKLSRALAGLLHLLLRDFFHAFKDLSPSKESSRYFSAAELEHYLLMSGLDWIPAKYSEVLRREFDTNSSGFLHVSELISAVRSVIGVCSWITRGSPGLSELIVSSLGEYIDLKPVVCDTGLLSYLFRLDTGGE